MGKPIVVRIPPARRSAEPQRSFVEEMPAMPHSRLSAELEDKISSSHFSEPRMSQIGRYITEHGSSTEGIIDTAVHVGDASRYVAGLVFSRTNDTDTAFGAYNQTLDLIIGVEKEAKQ